MVGFEVFTVTRAPRYSRFALYGPLVWKQPLGSWLVRRKACIYGIAKISSQFFSGEVVNTLPFFGPRGRDRTRCVRYYETGFLLFHMSSWFGIEVGY